MRLLVMIMVINHEVALVIISMGSVHTCDANNVIDSDQDSVLLPCH